jgi:hypothetical protein
MRSKTILSTVAFIVAFVLSSAFANLFMSKETCEAESRYTIGCNSETAAKISGLINDDKRNGRESARHAYETSEKIISPLAGSTFSLYADSVEQYIDASSNMKTCGFPPDFQTAWREHMRAWRDYSTLLNQMKNSSDREVWNQSEFEDAESWHGEEINNTWYEVIRLGRAYGADVSY